MTDFEPTTTQNETDTTATPVPTTAVDPPVPAGKPRSSRTRWLAAGVLIALVVALTGMATFALTSTKSTSVVLGYVPTDSVAYGELRLDLPGDQRQNVGAFLSKFPGFADQAALDTKLDRTVALKIPRRGQLSAQQLDEFFYEARVVAKLRHPYIVTVYEIGPKNW